MKKIFIFFLFVFVLNARYPRHEFSLGFFSLSVPISDFSDVANPALGFDISYRIGVNPLLIFNFITGYSFFIPKESMNIPDKKEKYSYHLIPFIIGVECAAPGYEKTFSPYLRVNAGLSKLITKISSEPSSTSQTNFSFRFDIGFYLSLLDFNFSYNRTRTEGKSNAEYLNFVIRYRIPINE